MEINRTPDTTGLNFMEEISAGMIVAFFTEDGEQSLANLKAEYQNFKNDALAKPRARMERALFRLYEVCRLILPYKNDVDLLGYAFDDDYYANVNAEVSQKYDSALADAEYEQALAAIREKDYAQAGAHFKAAALQGHVAAQYNYGVTIANGEMGDAPDLLEGAFWYYKAAKGGYAKAMINLAIAYRKGLGVHADGKMMIHWYATAANEEHPYGIYNLGLCLANEEVLGGNAIIGRKLMECAERLQDPSMCEYATNIASQIINILQEHVYNV